MKQKTLVTFVVFALLVVGVTAAVDSNSTQGQVLEIERGVSVHDQGEFDRLTIRTRDGETERLLLGQSGSCPNCVMVGDRVRAQLMNADASGATRRVRSMQVRRTGETIAVRNEAGKLIRERTRQGEGSDAAASNHCAGSRHEGRRQAGTRHGSGGNGYHGHR